MSPRTRSVRLHQPTSSKPPKPRSATSALDDSGRWRSKPPTTGVRGDPAFEPGPLRGIVSSPARYGGVEIHVIVPMIGLPVLGLSAEPRRDIEVASPSAQRQVFRP